MRAATRSLRNLRRPGRFHSLHIWVEPARKPEQLSASIHLAIFGLVEPLRLPRDFHSRRTPTRRPAQFLISPRRSSRKCPATEQKFLSPRPLPRFSARSQALTQMRTPIFSSPVFRRPFRSRPAFSPP